MRRSVSFVKDDPFAALGLPARADLPDEEVRAAWKRIAAATHPDREDGGDAAAYAAAAAAYDALRTSFGRGEALADLGPGRRAPDYSGRGWRVALRAAAAAGVTAAAVLAAGWTPATVGLVAGALTWVAVTSRPGLPWSQAAVTVRWRRGGRHR
jgi:curved DNA-binding protein CbpA